MQGQRNADIHRSDGYISLPGEWIELDIRDLATADMYRECPVQNPFE
jgi:hypothetical protein